MKWCCVDSETKTWLLCLPSERLNSLGLNIAFFSPIVQFMLVLVTDCYDTAMYIYIFVSELLFVNADAHMGQVYQ